MGKQLVRRIGKPLKHQDACEDLAMKFEQPMDELRILVKEQQDSYTLRRRRNEVSPDMDERQEKTRPSLAAKGETGKRVEIEQENCSDYKPKKSQLAQSSKPSKQEEVKEDLVKSENIRSICFINITTSCIILLPLTFNIKSVFLYKAARISFTSSCCSTNYAVPCPRSFNESAKFIEINSEKKGNFITEEAVKREQALVNMIIIGCILMLPFIYKVISVKFSTNYSSSFPRQDAKSCCSSTHGQTKSNSSPTTVSPGKVHQLFLNFRGEQLRYNFVSHLSDAFQRHEIKVFIDKDEQRGKELENLFVRIEESSIALAIFSTRYPESSWCMDELVKMKKLADQGKLRVIPIFYKVKAGDVRKPKRNSEFGENFWRLAEDASGDQIKEWREALESISHKMGLCLGEKRSEAKFIKETVKEVQRVLEAIGLEEE